MINPRPARSSEEPVPWLRRFLGPTVRPSFDATKESGRSARKCNALGATTARRREESPMDEIVNESVNGGNAGFLAKQSATADVGSITAIQSQRLSRSQRR